MQVFRIESDYAIAKAIQEAISDALLVTLLHVDLFLVHCDPKENLLHGNILSTKLMQIVGNETTRALHEL